MSDFDREAERRRLEEKYEKDREKRKSTQRMSELLLKGATMTNRHCDECGSPIFRHEGREFCPTCEAAGDGAEAAAGGADADAGERSTDAPATESAAGRPAASEAEADPESVRDVGPRAGATDAAEGADTADATTSAGRSDVEVRAADDPTGAPNPADDPEHTAGSGAPGVAGTEPGRGESPAGRSAAGAATAVNADRDAREALLEALTTHADRAAEAADPRRAQEHLAAAREAAEALAALDR